MLSDLLDRLQRILFFADKVADEVVGEETDVLEKTIPRMFKVMEMVSKYSCNYVKRGRFGRKSPLLGSASADDRRENDGWAGPPRKNRRNGKRVD
jgi:hypothetical protein